MSTSVATIIDSFDRLSTFGRSCGFTRHPSQRAYDMRRRGRIPARYWPGILRGAREAGVTLTLEMLVEAHSQQCASTSTAAA